MNTVDELNLKKTRYCTCKSALGRLVLALLPDQAVHTYMSRNHPATGGKLRIAGPYEAFPVQLKFKLAPFAAPSRPEIIMP